MGSGPGHHLFRVSVAASNSHHANVTHCATHWKLTLKINVRWYPMPFKLVKWYPGSSALCWSGCGLTGNLYHILCSCKNICSLCRNIFQFISEITGILTALNSGLAILNIGLDSFRILYRNVIANLLLSAKLTITRNCRKYLSLQILRSCEYDPTSLLLGKSDCYICWLSSSLWS